MVSNQLYTPSRMILLYPPIASASELTSQIDLNNMGMDVKAYLWNTTDMLRQWPFKNPSDLVVQQGYRVLMFAIWTQMGQHSIHLTIGSVDRKVMDLVGIPDKKEPCFLPTASIFHSPKQSRGFPVNILSRNLGTSWAFLSYVWD